MSIDDFTKLLEALVALGPSHDVIAILAAIYCSRQAVLRIVQTACNAIDRLVDDRSNYREAKRFKAMTATVFRRVFEMESLRLDRGRERQHTDQSG